MSKDTTAAAAAAATGGAPLVKKSMAPIKPVVAAAPATSAAPAAQTDEQKQAAWAAMGKPGVAPFTAPVAPPAGGGAPTGGTGGTDNSGAAAGAAGDDKTGSTSGTTPDFGAIFKSVFGEDPTTVKPPTNTPDYSKAKTDLENSRNAQTQSAQIDFVQQQQTLATQNTASIASLKARMMKLGVSPSDSSWDNALAGQQTRYNASLATAQQNYEKTVGNINAGIDSKMSDIAVTEAKDKVTAVQNDFDNLMKKMGLAETLYSVYSSRDQAEKQLEQTATDSLRNYNLNVSKMSQDQQSTAATDIQSNLQKGMYDMTDPKVLKMLQDAEKNNPFLQGEDLITMGAQGLVDRGLSIAQSKADIESKKASATASYAAAEHSRAAAKQIEEMPANQAGIYEDMMTNNMTETELMGKYPDAKSVTYIKSLFGASKNYNGTNIPDDINTGLTNDINSFIKDSKGMSLADFVSKVSAGNGIDPSYVEAQYKKLGGT
jgi:hypothetical protein